MSNVKSVKNSYTNHSTQSASAGLRRSRGFLTPGNHRTERESHSHTIQHNTTQYNTITSSKEGDGPLKK